MRKRTWMVLLGALIFLTQHAMADDWVLSPRDDGFLLLAVDSDDPSRRKKFVMGCKANSVYVSMTSHNDAPYPIYVGRMKYRIDEEAWRPLQLYTHGDAAALFIRNTWHDFPGNVWDFLLRLTNATSRFQWQQEDVNGKRYSADFDMSGNKGSLVNNIITDCADHQGIHSPIIDISGDISELSVMEASCKGTLRAAIRHVTVDCLTKERVYDYRWSKSISDEAQVIKTIWNQGRATGRNPTLLVMCEPGDTLACFAKVKRLRAVDTDNDIDTWPLIVRRSSGTAE